MKPLEERVQAGVAFLDEHVPGWQKGVFPDQLRIADCQCCVLGQLYGEYEDGREALAVTTPKSDSTDWAISHGFFSWDNFDYPRLTDLWRKALIVEPAVKQEN